MSINVLVNCINMIEYKSEQDFKQRKLGSRVLAIFLHSVIIADIVYLTFVTH